MEGSLAGRLGLNSSSTANPPTWSKMSLILPICETRDKWENAQRCLTWARGAQDTLIPEGKPEVRWGKGLSKVTQWV